MPPSSSFAAYPAAVLAACLVTIFTLPGCGRGEPTFAPVSGTVTMDGKPIARAAVLFVPPEHSGLAPATGETDAAGRFQLSTGDRPGAAPGNYQVGIRCVETTGLTTNELGLVVPVGNQPVEVRWHVPERYGNLATSGLTATVVPGGNDVRFDLKAAPPHRSPDSSRPEHGLGGVR